MAKKKEQTPEVQPEAVVEVEEAAPQKPRSIIVAASEGGTNTIKVKTTRELYMEDNQ